MFRHSLALWHRCASPQLHLFLFISATFVACGVLLTGRVIFTRSINYLFLPFNLLLAVCPILFSALFANSKRMEARVILAGLWLLFFPNAPYILTDLVHLPQIGGANGAPLWFDVLLVAAYAGAGLIFGYISLLQMQRSLAMNFPRLSWGVVVLSSFLAGFGIYLGRFLRWHSVHLFFAPLPLLLDVADRFLNPLSHPRAWGVTLGFGALILFGYLAVLLTARLARFSSGDQARRRPWEHGGNIIANW